MFGGISRFLLGCKYFKERYFSSTDYHRFAQIILISKDIVIITDFYQ